MATITPDGLPLASLPINPTDLFIAQQGPSVLRLNYNDLQTQLQTATLTYIDTALSVAYGNVTTQINNLQTLLGTKAGLNHTHTKADVGLGNVENLSPADLPLSNALITALAGKVNIGECLCTSVLINGTAEW